MCHGSLPQLPSTIGFHSGNESEKFGEVQKWAFGGSRALPFDTL